MTTTATPRDARDGIEQERDAYREAAGGLSPGEFALKDRARTREHNLLVKENRELRARLAELEAEAAGAAQRAAAYQRERDEARAHAERMIAIGKNFEEDARKHFDQSCRNLQRAEAAERDLAALRRDMQELSTEDERGHAIIDEADGEDPDTSSVDTLADRVERLVLRRDAATARAETLQAELTQMRTDLHATVNRTIAAEAERDAARNDVANLTEQLDRIYALPMVREQGDRDHVADCVEALVEHIECVRTEAEGAGREVAAQDVANLIKSAAAERDSLRAELERVKVEASEVVAATTNRYVADLTKLGAALEAERDSLRAELAAYHDALAALPGCDTPRSPQDVRDAAAALADAEAKYAVANAERAQLEETARRMAARVETLTGALRGAKQHLVEAAANPRHFETQAIWLWLGPIDRALAQTPDDCAAVLAERDARVRAAALEEAAYAAHVACERPSNESAPLSDIGECAAEAVLALLDETTTPREGA